MGTNSTRTQHWADYKYGGMMGDRGPRTPNNLDKAPRPTLQGPKTMIRPPNIFSMAPHITISLNDDVPVVGIKMVYYAPTVGKGAVSVAFVRPSVMYTANNSRTQRPSVPKFGKKVPHLRCDSHTSFKVKWSKVTVRGGWGHTVSAKPCDHTAC